MSGDPISPLTLINTRQTQSQSPLRRVNSKSGGFSQPNSPHGYAQLEPVKKPLKKFDKGGALLVRVVSKVCKDKTEKRQRVFVLTNSGIYVCHFSGTVNRFIVFTATTRVMYVDRLLLVRCLGQPDLVLDFSPNEMNASEDMDLVLGAVHKLCQEQGGPQYKFERCLDSKDLFQHAVMSLPAREEKAGENTGDKGDRILAEKAGLKKHNYVLQSAMALKQHFQKQVDETVIAKEQEKRDAKSIECAVELLKKYRPELDEEGRKEIIDEHQGRLRELVTSLRRLVPSGDEPVKTTLVQEEDKSAQKESSPPTSRQRSVSFADEQMMLLRDEMDDGPLAAPPCFIAEERNVEREEPKQCRLTEASSVESSPSKEDEDRTAATAASVSSIDSLLSAARLIEERLQHERMNAAEYTRKEEQRRKGFPTSSGSSGRTASRGGLDPSWSDAIQKIRPVPSPPRSERARELSCSREENVKAWQAYRDQFHDKELAEKEAETAWLRERLAASVAERKLVDEPRPPTLKQRLIPKKLNLEMSPTLSEDNSPFHREELDDPRVDLSFARADADQATRPLVLNESPFGGYGVHVSKGETVPTISHRKSEVFGAPRAIGRTNEPGPIFMEVESEQGCDQEGPVSMQHDLQAAIERSEAVVAAALAKDGSPWSPTATSTFGLTASELPTIEEPVMPPFQVSDDDFTQTYLLSLVEETPDQLECNDTFLDDLAVFDRSLIEIGIDLGPSAFVTLQRADGQGSMSVRATTVGCFWMLWRKAHPWRLRASLRDPPPQLAVDCGCECYVSTQFVDFLRMGDLQLPEVQEASDKDHHPTKQIVDVEVKAYGGATVTLRWPLWGWNAVIQEWNFGL